MELLNIVIGVNDFLEKFSFFRAFKFIMALYLIILSLNIVLLLYILLIKKRYWYDFSFGRSVPKIRGIMNKRWKEVVESINSGNSNYYKSAVVEAGDILYVVLNKLNYPGDDLTEQLKQMIGYQITNIDDVRWADGVRRGILSDVNYDLTEEDARRAVKAFGEAIFEMEAIDNLLLED